MSQRHVTIPHEITPPEIEGWNWGAFLLTWIWGIGNNVWLTLFCFIPIVGIIGRFILGAKGNKLAWNNRHWPSVEAFKKTQRRWAIGGLVFWCSLILLVLVLFFGVTSNLENSKLSQESFQQVEHSARIRSLIGAPIQRKGITQGSIETNGGGTGKTDISYHIRGPKGEATVYARGIKEAGVWEMRSLIIRTTDNQNIKLITERRGK